MRAYLYVSILAAASATSCKSLDCAPGTIERADQCVPADETVSPAKCGAFTELQGDQCVPMFPPTVCDPGSTAASTDPTTGVTTCIGTGAGGSCSGAFACPAPAAGKQTACGQIYDLVTGMPFEAPGATGTLCGSATAATGPCSLAIEAFDAVGFASNPTTTAPLAIGELDIDDCGRFRVKDITPPTGPLVALGLDDAPMALRGPTGNTQSVGIAFPKMANMSTANLEDFVVTSAQTDAWTASGGPMVSDGIFVAIYRAHVTGFDDQPGVAVVKDGSPIPSDDFYFGSAATTRTTIDPAADATGLTGTALVQNGSISSFYTGNGGLGSNCQWEPHPGAKVPNVVFVQIFRPEDKGGTCAQ